MPPDVRKGSAFPLLLPGEFSEATPRECVRGVASATSGVHGKPKAFRTSGGKAASTGIRYRERFSAKASRATSLSSK
jgi:hypothetical protein